ncbi:MAG: PLP-dependent transferase [Helicobacter sp.]|nr:PLP-dependent transferase [Helicobacter sp.]
MLNLETSSVHTANPLADSTDSANPLIESNDPFGASRLPLYNNATFEYASSDMLAKVSKNMAFGYVYTRSSNPTVHAYEDRIRGMSGAMGVIATTSGMSAIVLAALSLLKSGDRLVSTGRVFGHTLGFFAQTLAGFGIEAVLIDIEDENALKSALSDSRVKMLFFETLNNPWLQIVDLRKVCSLAHEHGVPVVADCTLTPFAFFNAKKFGIDVEIISSTKIISGGGGGLGGLVLDYGTFDWSKHSNLKDIFKKSGKWAFLYKARKEILVYLGLIAAPYNAHMHISGLETLTLRANKACQNALAIAEFLESHSIPTNYVALRSSPYFALCQEQFNGQGGCILTFKLGSKKRAYAFMDALRIIKIATNIYDTKTLIISPSDVIYPDTPIAEQEALGITSDMLRLSVGIENVEDLIADIKVALQKADSV